MDQHLIDSLKSTARELLSLPKDQLLALIDAPDNIGPFSAMAELQKCVFDCEGSYVSQPFTVLAYKKSTAYISSSSNQKSFEGTVTCQAGSMSSYYPSDDIEDYACAA